MLGRNSEIRKAARMNFMLGKLPPKLDKRTLKLAHYLELNELPPLQSSVMNSPAVKVPWGMMFNDTEGDCTCAAMGHIVMAITANAGAVVVPSDDQVQAMYEQIGGYVPGNASTDNGATELDACKYMQQTGLAGVKLDAFADITIINLTDLKYSVQLFGAAYIGVNLPQSAMDNFDAGQKLWSDTTDTNILGGHAVPLIDYDEVGPYCITWGQRQQMTWAWYAQYCDEAHAPLFLQGFKPSGLNLAALEADLKLVTA
jgi:hypothetical protein